jgi:hypothetical protein
MGEPLGQVLQEAVSGIAGSLDQRGADEKSRQDEEQQHADGLHDGQVSGPHLRYEKHDAMADADHLRGDRAQKI